MMANCRVQSDGFVATSVAAEWRLGAILFARCANTFVAVRKALVEGTTYEFAGMYSLPGGMVRAAASADADQIPAEELVQVSLGERAHREAGLSCNRLSRLRASALGPIMTSYAANGRQRFTLVVAFEADVEVDAPLEAADSSVDDAFWAPIPPDWERMAPANRLAVAHIVWKLLDEEGRTAARCPLERALNQCSEWAEAVQVPAAAAPWASSEELSAWHAAWPV